MALMKCNECDHEVSKKAKTCPSCGAPVKVPPKEYGCGTLLLVLVVMIILLKACSSSESYRASSSTVPDSVCKETLQCWGDKYSSYAGVYCDEHVERFAKYSFEWTDGVLGSKFTHFRWLNKEKGTVTFIGDKIKFQNGFGAWGNYIYECDFDPKSNIVIDVRAREGRLQ